MLTLEQKLKLVHAFASGHGIADTTDDPQVNYEIDKMSSPEDYPETWEQLDEGERRLYREEAKLIADKETRKP